jgi:DNA-directed RNA polymerase II subunit RPB2
VVNQKDALDFIAKKTKSFSSERKDRIDYCAQLIDHHVLPHIGLSETSRVKKTYFLGYIVHKLLLVGLMKGHCILFFFFCMLTALGLQTPGDRDHYGNKRLNLAGALLTGLFRQLFNQMVKEASSRLQRSVNNNQPVDDKNLNRAFNDSIITNGMKYCLATGNWGTVRGQPQATGVAQVLSRLTFASTLSHLRRLNSPIGRDGKLARPRQLHNTHWGYICPVEV